MQHFCSFSWFLSFEQGVGLRCVCPLLISFGLCLFLLVFFFNVHKCSWVPCDGYKTTTLSTGNMVQHNDEQKAVISAAPHITVARPLKVKAFAGAGKTTTLVGVARAMQAQGGYFAFNREIALEAQQKFKGTGCTASTMHALALSVM